jgi:Na+/H+-dicarboxylate symporter
MLILVIGIASGVVLGLGLGAKAVILKPLGDIFLNLLFTAVVPLVFFSISSAIASMSNVRRLARVMGWMMVFFILTGIISSGLMIALVTAFPPFSGSPWALPEGVTTNPISVAETLVRTFTTADFLDLLSKKNMLPLILFALLIGIATSSSGEKGSPFARFLIAGNAVMGRVIGLIMLYAPIGLGSYIAYLVGSMGPQIMGSYARVILLYYPSALVYFFVAFSLYVYWAASGKGLIAFWKNIPSTAFTALATGSSVATIPANLEAARKLGVKDEIRDVIIPVGATIHMEGSCLAAIVKIAFLFGLFQMPFTGWDVWLTAIGIAVLSGTVISGIPAGGMIGELLIVTLYGFPIAALPLITMIGTIVDPPATMLNAVGDNVTCLMVSRKLHGPHWFTKTTLE